MENDWAWQPEAEQALIGSVLRTPDMLSIASFLTMEDFSSEKHRRVWAVITEIGKEGEPLNLTAVVLALRDKGQLEGIGGILELGRLEDCGVSIPEMLPGLSRRIRGATLRRNLMKELEAAQQHIIAEQPDASNLSELRAKLGRKEELGSGKSGLVSMQDEIARIGLDSLLAPPEGLVPVPWPTMRYLIGGGFQPGQLIIVGALANVGKSITGMQLADCAISHGIGTAVFSIEMGLKQLMLRELSRRTGMTPTMLSSGNLSPKDRPMVMQAASAISQLLRVTDDPSVTLAKIDAELEVNDGCAVAVIDYLGMLKSGDKTFKARHEEVAHLAKELKLIAKRRNRVLIVLSQMKTPERGKKPQLEDIAESKRVGEHADTVLLLSKEVSESGAEYFQAHLVKARDGQQGAWKMGLDRNSMQFYELTGEV